MRIQTVSALLWIISKLPFWLLYIISDVLYLIIFYIVRYRKGIVFKNLQRSFPEKSEQEIRAIAKRFYRYLPDIIVESIKMYSISRKEVLDRIEIINTEEMQQHFDKNKGVICVTSHYCNWELAIHRLPLMTEHPSLVIYKPLNNKDIDHIYNSVRTRYGAIMVPMKQILRHVARLRHSPYVSVFASDQTPLNQDSDYYIDFLNQHTLVYTGAERIARFTGNPVVFCHIGRKKKRGYYYCKFTTLVENPNDLEEHEITKIHNKFTEEIIKKEPEYWLWSHNRWKR